MSFSIQIDQTEHAQSFNREAAIEVMQKTALDLLSQRKPRIAQRESRLLRKFATNGAYAIEHLMLGQDLGDDAQS